MKRIILMAFAATMLYSCESETAPATAETDATIQTTMTTDGREVPATVTQMFDDAYPGVSGVTWNIDDSMYKATFNNTGLDMSVTYLPDGRRYAVAAAIAPEYLPEAVSKAATTLGPITSAYKITMDNGIVRYEVIIKDEDYFFDESGAMIQEDNAIEEMKKAL